MKSSVIAYVLNVPWSIVSTILANWKVRGSVKSLKSRCGRHRKLSDHDARVLARYVEDDRRQTLSELSSLLNVNHKTTRLYLHDLGFRYCIAPKKPYPLSISHCSSLTNLLYSR
jgi:transposase